MQNCFIASPQLLHCIYMILKFIKKILLCTVSRMEIMKENKAWNKNEFVDYSFSIDPGIGDKWRKVPPTGQSTFGGTYGHILAWGLAQVPSLPAPECHAVGQNKSCTTYSPFAFVFWHHAYFPVCLSSLSVRFGGRRVRSGKSGCKSCDINLRKSHSSVDFALHFYVFVRCIVPANHLFS